MLSTSIRLVAVSGFVLCGATAASHFPAWKTRQRRFLSIEDGFRAVSAFSGSSRTCGTVPQRVLACCEACSFEEGPLQWYGASVYEGTYHITAKSTPCAAALCGMDSHLERLKCRLVHKACVLSPWGLCSRIVLLKQAEPPTEWTQVEDAVAEDVGRLHQLLHVYEHKLPDVQCASADKCSLFPVDRAYVFNHSEVNKFMANLFVSIHQATGNLQCAPQVCPSVTPFRSHDAR